MAPHDRIAGYPAMICHGEHVWRHASPPGAGEAVDVCLACGLTQGPALTSGPPAAQDAPEGRTEGLLALCCPYCQAGLRVTMETVGRDYLTYEQPEAIGCVGCDAEWEPDGHRP